MGGFKRDGFEQMLHEFTWGEEEAYIESIAVNASHR